MKYYIMIVTCLTVSLHAGPQMSREERELVQERQAREDKLSMVELALTWLQRYPQETIEQRKEHFERLVDIRPQAIWRKMKQYKADPYRKQELYQQYLVLCEHALAVALSIKDEQPDLMFDWGVEGDIIMACPPLQGPEDKRTIHEVKFKESLLDKLYAQYAHDFDTQWKMWEFLAEPERSR